MTNTSLEQQLFWTEMAVDHSSHVLGNMLSIYVLTFFVSLLTVSNWMVLICPESVTYWGDPQNFLINKDNFGSIWTSLEKISCPAQKTWEPIFQPFSREKTCNWRLLKVMHHSLLLGTTEGSDLFGRQEKKSLKSFLEETGADAIVIGSIDLLKWSIPQLKVGTYVSNFLFLLFPMWKVPGLPHQSSEKKWNLHQWTSSKTHLSGSQIALKQHSLLWTPPLHRKPFQLLLWKWHALYVYGLGWLHNTY